MIEPRQGSAPRARRTRYAAALAGLVALVALAPAAPAATAAQGDDAGEAPAALSPEDEVYRARLEALLERMAQGYHPRQNEADELLADYEGGRIIRDLVAALDEERFAEKHTRATIYTFLGKFPAPGFTELVYTDEAQVEQFFIGLADPFPNIRRFCASYMISLGPTHRDRAVEGLNDLLRDRNWKVQLEAARSLATMSVSAPSTIQRLRRQLDNPNKQEAQRWERVREAAEEARRTPELDVREQFAETLMIVSRDVTWLLERYDELDERGKEALEAALVDIGVRTRSYYDGEPESLLAVARILAARYPEIEDFADRVKTSQVLMMLALEHAPEEARKLATPIVLGLAGEEDPRFVSTYETFLHLTDEVPDVLPIEDSRVVVKRELKSVVVDGDWGARGLLGISAVYYRPLDLDEEAPASSSLFVRDVETGELLARFDGQRGRARFAKVSPDGRWLVSGTGVSVADPVLYVWDLEKKELAGTLFGHADTPYDAAFSPDGQLLASCDVAGDVHVWDFRERARRATYIGGEDQPLERVAFLRDGSGVVTGSEPGRIAVWKLSQPDGARTPSSSTEAQAAITALTLSPDGGRLAVGTAAGHMSLYDVEQLELERRFAPTQGGVRALAFSHDGRLLASGSAAAYEKGMATTRTPGFARLWDVATAKELTAFTGLMTSNHVLAFAPDGDSLFGADDTVRLRVWSLPEAQQSR